MSGSRNQRDQVVVVEPHVVRWRSARPSICAHTSSLISSREAAAIAGLPLKLPGAVQLEMSTDRMPPTLPSPYCRKVVAVPELALRDRRQRPVASRDRSHDRRRAADRFGGRTGCRSSIPCATRRGARATAPRANEVRRDEPLHHFHGQRARRSSRPSPASSWPSRSIETLRIRLPCRWNPRRVAFGTSVTPSAAQMRSPRIDPHVVRRTGEQAVEDASRNQDPVEELQQDAPDGARAAVLRAHCDERAGHPLPEIAPIVFGT